ncbi:hypothetical protein HTK96_02870 [Brevundimonas vesicularis]|uniref:hypothetical protein n=1 Tax=Brevundimonas vesicularis TaxID=41276 RepID=UPI001572DE86|nr:hypothetical protein [Brevundimonas vesicularis]NSX32309.1 hypothetical protein [Brevundimonas vesicularis]
MTARITTQTNYSVFGKLTETAPILAWLADQAPSASVKMHDRQEYERSVSPGEWFGFDVSFKDETDEVNFKMFQSEAFEAQAEFERADVGFYRITSTMPGLTVKTVGTGRQASSLIIDDYGFIAGVKRGGK